MNFERNIKNKKIAINIGVAKDAYQVIGGRLHVLGQESKRILNENILTLIKNVNLGKIDSMKLISPHDVYLHLATPDKKKYREIRLSTLRNEWICVFGELYKCPDYSIRR